MHELIPLVISGAPRSGTSLVYNLFDGHTHISWLLDEGFLFENLYAFGAGDTEIFLACARRDVETFVSGLRDKQLIPPLDKPYVQSAKRGSVSEFRLESSWDEAAFRRVLTAGMNRLHTVEALWDLAARGCLAGMGQPVKRYGCLKAPDYGKSAAAAVATIPAARALVVLRDPLYALDSLKRSRELRNEKQLSWPVFALCVLEMQNMLRRIRAADPARLFWLRYEELVQRPQAMMERIAAWLDIPFEQCLLEPTMLGRHWPGISSFKATVGIEKAPAQRNIASLTDEEQATARRHLAEYREFGYSLD